MKINAFSRLNYRKIIKNVEFLKNLRCSRYKKQHAAGELVFVKKSCGFRPLRSRKSSDFFYG